MNYVPLAYLAITIIGAAMALSEITPVAQPPRLVMIGRTSGNDGLAFGYLPPVTTPAGDPGLFAYVKCQHYEAPPQRHVPARLRPARPYRAAPAAVSTPALPVANRGWMIPPVPVFTPQTPTPTTGEQVAIA